MTKWSASPSPSSSDATASPGFAEIHSAPQRRRTRAIFREGTASKQCWRRARTSSSPALDRRRVDRRPAPRNIRVRGVAATLLPRTIRAAPASGPRPAPHGCLVSARALARVERHWLALEREVDDLRDVDRGLEHVPKDEDVDLWVLQRVEADLGHAREERDGLQVPGVDEVVREQRGALARLRSIPRRVKGDANGLAFRRGLSARHPAASSPRPARADDPRGKTRRRPYRPASWHPPTASPRPLSTDAALSRWPERRRGTTGAPAPFASTAERLRRRRGVCDE